MATASSVYALSDQAIVGPAPLAIDGMLDTSWESNWMVDPQWLDVDFGMTVYVSEVDVLWQACATDYTLELSNDEMKWTTIATITNNTAHSIDAPANWASAAVHTGLSGSGRYLRVNGTVRCPGNQLYGYEIWEIRAYGSPTCQP
jgi:endo-1,3(4)-beta-glucanase